ncbi:RidA family protein [Pseudonocardia acaciae]|uniref:RidA family protein n=1 Tax=Pseudonocardia acaciae TaxID=551276 RepID=UPI00048ACC38|nr:RidA family protein [Pseudonocardia acaciae]
MTTTPTPSGHYALAVRRGDWLFVAGQTGEDALGDLGDLAEQTGGAVANIAAVLAAHGATLDDVVRMTCYLVGLPDPGVFTEFDRAYSASLGDRHPARTTVGVAGLPAGELIEIEATAVIPG